MKQEDYEENEEGSNDDPDDGDSDDDNEAKEDNEDVYDDDCSCEVNILITWILMHTVFVTECSL